MSNLAHRQAKIQDKRKQTPWREFVMEICSWFPLNLYKNQGMISRYPETGREGKIVKLFLYNHENYVTQELDNNSSFMSQYFDLWKNSQKAPITHFVNNENSDFVDMAYGAKNCYLSFSVGGGCENVLYSTCIATNIDNVLNSFSVTDNCSNIYTAKAVTGSYNIFYGYNIHNSSNCWFSSNLLGCNECLLCDNLQNQSYCINNIGYPKEDYFVLKLQYLENKEKYDFYRQNISNSGENYQSTKTQGNAIIFSSDVVNGQTVTRFTNARNIFYGVGSEIGSSSMYDGIDVGINSHYFYAVVGSGTNGEHYYCTQLGGLGTDLYYCSIMEGCSFCLGCIGLKNKSFCILNKQYTKEERYEKVDEIFAQMDVEGTLGQFFPATMNPFYFNDTAAYLIDPSFTKEEVTEAGYLRRDEPIKVDIPEGVTVVSTKDLGQYEGWTSSLTPSPVREGGDEFPSLVGEGLGVRWHINPDILKVIIQDDAGNVYKIVKMEYDFLMKHGLPLPRTHRLDRMKENFKIN